MMLLEKKSQRPTDLQPLVLKFQWWNIIQNKMEKNEFKHEITNDMSSENLSTESKFKVWSNLFSKLKNPIDQSQAKKLQSKKCLKDQSQFEKRLICHQRESSLFMTWNPHVDRLRLAQENHQWRNHPLNQWSLKFTTLLLKEKSDPREKVLKEENYSLQRKENERPLQMFISKRMEALVIWSPEQSNTEKL